MLDATSTQPLWEMNMILCIIAFLFIALITLHIWITSTQCSAEDKAFNGLDNCAEASDRLLTEFSDELGMLRNTYRSEIKAEFIGKMRKMTRYDVLNVRKTYASRGCV